MPRYKHASRDSFWNYTGGKDGCGGKPKEGSFNSKLEEPAKEGSYDVRILPDGFIDGLIAPYSKQQRDD